MGNSNRFRALTGWKKQSNNKNLTSSQLVNEDWNVNGDWNFAGNVSSDNPISAADPVDPQDLVTLSYFNTNAGLYQGVLDASAGISYPAATEGMFWRISVAGTIGTTLVEVGDQVIAIADYAGGMDDTKFMIVQANTHVIPPKVYVALLTQTTVSTTSGLLVVGKTYLIMNLVAGDDFANVGYTSINIPFIATGTTPTNWTNSTEVINVTDSVPVATVLENTIGEVPTYVYENPGSYSLKTVGAIMLETKTAVTVGASRNTSKTLCEVTYNSDTELLILTNNLSGTFIDNVLYQTKIEISIYP
jgi:hypothetical protein